MNNVRILNVLFVLGMGVVYGGEYEYTCVICGHGYHHEQSLRLHMAKHAGDTTCPLCYKIYNRKADMNRHMKNIHYR